MTRTRPPVPRASRRHLVYCESFLPACILHERSVPLTSLLQVEQLPGHHGSHRLGYQRSCFEASPESPANDKRRGTLQRVLRVSALLRRTGSCFTAALCFTSATMVSSSSSLHPPRPGGTEPSCRVLATQSRGTGCSAFHHPGQRAWDLIVSTHSPEGLGCPPIIQSRGTRKAVVTQSGGPGIALMTQQSRGPGVIRA